MAKIKQTSLEEMMRNMTNGALSSKEIDDIIKELSSMRNAVKSKEKAEEKERKRREEERKRQEEERKERERIENVTCMELPLDYQNLYEMDPNAMDVKVDNASDALIASLNNLGKVDIEYMSKISGLKHKELIVSLKGSIYQNPSKWEECFYKGWETADEYLSGNLLRKRQRAVEMDYKYKGWFTDNVKAIDAVLPDAVSIKDIYVTLGSPWVPTDVIEDFIDYMYNHKKSYFPNRGSVRHDEITGAWEIEGKWRYDHDTLSTNVYGTMRREALSILERTLNMQSVAVTDEVPCATTKSGVKRVINTKETILAKEKQNRMIKLFQEWVWRDKERSERLQMIFENKFSAYRTRKYDGSFLVFPKMNPAIKLYPYQKNAIARILFSDNTLLAHEVGSGKTYVMIAAGMELKRMGLSRKNLYVVPNALVGQWQGMFMDLYPSAKILVVEPKHFTPKKKEETLAKIRDNDYDAIIMPHSSFDKIDLSISWRMDMLREMRDKLEEKKRHTRGFITIIDRKLEKIRKQLQELSEKEKDPLANTRIYFDELGITRLFVDEAHYYKNVFIESKIGGVPGISNASSEKCNLMMEKVHYVQRKNDGKGVVFATGTPITNSLTDAFIMQSYLQSGELTLLEINNFDSWIGMFAEKEENFEIDVDTSKYRLVTRFSKFHNLPELTLLLSSIADFHVTENNAELPTFSGYKDATIAKTSDFEAFLKDISERAEEVRTGAVKRTDDNMLKITVDGRKGALDMRLIDNSLAFNYTSKVASCAENVYAIYDRTREERLTQLIFCDTSVPNDTHFNVYDEMRRLLVWLGVSNDEIAYVHSADTEKKREELFARVRQGKIRVLLGSTFKLGTGVNVQDRLVAVHHLDVPWRPADMVQREGRMLRPGNRNDVVFIYRYITEGSFDAYSWQLLESKQRFISALLAGSVKERDKADIDDTVLNYAEVKALAIGNPLIKTRVEKANALSRLYSLQNKYVENREMLMRKRQEMPEEIVRAEELVEKCLVDLEYFKANKCEYNTLEKRKIAEVVLDGLKDNEMQMQERVIGEYQGFKIVLPANMFKDSPFFYLERESRHRIEAGESELGLVQRMQNYLESLGKRYDRLRYRLNALKLDAEDIETELNKDGGYTEQIEQLTIEIEQIDKQLGVKQ